MKVVLTGATGTLGSSILRRLNERGESVVAVGRREPQGGGRFVPIDLSTLDATFLLRRELASADVLVNAAGLVPHNRNDRTALEVNLTMARSVIEACAGAEVRVVHLGSTSVYGETTGASEDSSCHPLNAYGECHHRIETMFAALGDRCCTARTAAVFGQIDGGSIHQLAARLTRGRVFPLPWPPVRKSLIHTDDLGDAVVAILDEALPGAVNVAAGAIDLGDVVSALCRGLGIRRPRFVSTPRGVLSLASRCARYVAPASTIGSSLATLSQQSTVVTDRLTAIGWQPACSLRDRLEQFGLMLRAA